MKTIIRHKIRLYALVISCCMVLSGCEVLFELAGEASVGEAAIGETALLKEGLLTGIEEGILERGIIVESEALAVENSALEVSLVSDEQIFSSLEKIELRPGRNGRFSLFAKGRNNPFAEISNSQRSIRLVKSGKYIQAKSSIFQVKNGEIVVRAGNSPRAAVVTTVNNGDYIAELQEIDGWYQVEVWKNGYFTKGWIPSSSSLVLLLIGKDDNTLIEKKKKEEERKKTDYNKLINPFFANLKNSTEISVFVVDENGQYSSVLSSGLAKIYSESSYNANSCFFKPAFAYTNGFDSLLNGSMGVWAKTISAYTYTDYIAVANIHYTCKDGVITNGTRTCNQILNMHIYSTQNRALVSSFKVNVNGIGFRDEEAKNVSVMHLLTRFKIDHSTI